MNLKTFKNTKLFIWCIHNYALLIGAIVVLALSATTFHSDLTYISIVAQRVAQGNFDIYSQYYVGGVVHGAPIMPPLIFLFDGLLFWILKICGILRFNFVINNIPTWQFFLLKMRYFMVFIASYFLIREIGHKYTEDNKKAQRIANLWITSPILLYLTFTQGNNDIYPVFFTLIFLLFVCRKEYFWAMVSLGLAAAMKNYAVFLFLPMAIILANKDIKKTIYYLITAGVTFILPMILYFKHFMNFGQAGGEGLLMLESVITSRVSFMIFPMAYFITILYLYFSDNEKQLSENKEDVVIFYGFLIMALFFTLAFYIPQWYLWLLPFFILTIFKNVKLFWLYIISTGVFLFSIITNWVNNIDVNLFRPLMKLPPSAKIFVLDPDVFRSSMAYSAFAAVMLVFMFFLIKNYPAKTNDNLPKYYVFWNLAPLIGYLTVMALFIYLSIIGFSL